MNINFLQLASLDKAIYLDNEVERWKEGILTYKEKLFDNTVEGIIHENTLNNNTTSIEIFLSLDAIDKLDFGDNLISSHEREGLQSISYNTGISLQEVSNVLYEKDMDKLREFSTRIADDVAEHFRENPSAGPTPIHSILVARQARGAMSPLVPMIPNLFVTVLFER